MLASRALWRLWCSCFGERPVKPSPQPMSLASDGAAQPTDPEPTDPQYADPPTDPALPRCVLAYDADGPDHPHARPAQGRGSQGRHRVSRGHWQGRWSSAVRARVAGIREEVRAVITTEFV